MRHHQFADFVTIIDCLIAFLVISSAALIFLKHELRSRGEHGMSLGAHYSYFLMPIMAVVMSGDINDAIFHFSGYTGLTVTCMISVALFTVVPAVIVEEMCRNHYRVVPIEPAPAPKVRRTVGTRA